MSASSSITRDLLEHERLEAEKLRRAGREDPVAFARTLTLIEASGEIRPFAPDPWQCDVLRHQGDRMILNVARQCGKSTTLAALSLHRAIYVPKSLVLIISGAQRQSDELLRKVVDFLSRLSIRPKLSEDNKRSIEFDNGSRIVALPAKDGTIRGFSAPAILIEDEAGEVPDSVHAAVRPMLMRSTGKFLMSGTPKGKRGHFYETWIRGGDEWKRIELKAKESPSVNQQWLTREHADLARRGMEEIYRQEYECAFIDAAAGRVYGGFDEERNLVDRLPDADARAPWHYILGADFGIVDPNALTVLAWREYDPCVYIAESYKLRGDARIVGEEIKRLDERYHFDRIVGDVGGMGKGFEADMRTYQHIPIHAAEKHNKVGYVSLMNGELRTGRIKLVRETCPELLEEWLTLAWAEGGKKEAEGLDNHCADSALYGWRACNAHHPAERPVHPADLTHEQRMAKLLEAECNKWKDRDKAEIEHYRRHEGKSWLEKMEAEMFGDSDGY